MSAMYLHQKFICSVYWIHLSNHSWNDGYIGVSIDPSRRFTEHQSSKQRYRLHEEIKNNESEIIYDIIYIGTEESCYDFEKELRPTIHIGWNLAAGGIGGTSGLLKGVKKSKPAHNKGKPMSEEQKEHLRQIMTGCTSSNKGKSHGPKSQEIKDKISKTGKALNRIGHWSGKIKGPISDETKEKIRQAKLGKPNLGYKK